jgi:putative ABC transport system permease protein
MNTLLQDVRHSFRLLARNRGFALFSILILAIALGANTAVFSVMNGVLLRALPYPAPDRIVDVSIVLPPREGSPATALLDGPMLEAWQEGTRTVERLAAYRTQSFTLSSRGNAERLTGASVSSSLFSLLRVAPARGRAFQNTDQRPGSERVVLLSHVLWQRHFQRDPNIVGTPVTLEGTAHTVVGVMPESFYFPNREVLLWTPLVVDAPASATAGVIDVEYYPAIARLRDGASIEQASAEATSLLRRTSQEGRVRLAPLRDQMVAEVRPAVLMMTAAVGLVLLIACINLANLLLVRRSARQREMAIRSAVGGSRGRLVRQMLTESVVLSFAGGIAGVLVTAWAHRLLLRLLPRGIPRIEEAQLDARVFLFAFLLSGLTGLLFGLLPALRSAGGSLARDLHGGGAETSRRSAAGSVLIVAEVALAFVLLVGAGLLLRSFLQLVRVELGYEPDRVLIATLQLDPARYGAPGRTGAFYDALLSRIEGREEVESVGIVSFPPMTQGFSLMSLEVVGQPPARTLAIPQMSSPGYLGAMGLRLVEGRWLTPEDHASEAPVAVVNKSFVRKHIQGPGAMGRRLQVGSASLEIVGILEDVRLLGLDSDPKPELFTSYRHAEAVAGSAPERMTLAIRSAGDPLALLPFLRAALYDLDPELALQDVKTMEARLDDAEAQPRFYALLLAVFAGIALALAAAGVYAVLSYSVSRQTRAIGVRRVLGAQRSDILALVWKKGLLLVLMGLVTGSVAAVMASRAVARLLFGVTTRDPLSYAVAALSLAIVALLACYLPARRATRVEPVEALRYD